MSIIDIMKRVAMDTGGAQNPVNIVFGTVTSIDPIEIEVHQKLKLTKDFIVLTERVTRYEIDVLATKVVIREGLKKGDGVVMLRVQGGQQYVVTDKVVD